MGRDRNQCLFRRRPENHVLVLAKRGLFKVAQPEFELLLNKVWAYFLATAACPQALRRNSRSPTPIAITLWGLVHDVGKLILLQYFSDMARRISQRLRVGASVMEAAVKQMDEYMAAQG